MAISPGKARNSSGKRPVRRSRWLLASAGLAGMAAIGVAGAVLLAPHEGVVRGGPGLCPHFAVDPSTGKMRDRGMIPCDLRAAENGRIDLSRKDFNQHRQASVARRRSEDT